MAKKKFYESLRFKLLEFLNSIKGDFYYLPQPGETIYDCMRRLHGNAPPRSLYAALYNLNKEKLIKRFQKGRKTIFKITPKGKLKLFMNRVFNNLIREKEKEKDWDGKWRLIIFDIPEKKRKMRDFLRAELKLNDFYALQKSVWITPYKISEDFEQLLKELGIHYYIRYMVVEHINYEIDLIKKFKI